MFFKIFAKVYRSICSTRFPPVLQRSDVCDKCWDLPGRPRCIWSTGIYIVGQVTNSVHNYVFGKSEHGIGILNSIIGMNLYIIGVKKIYIIGIPYSTGNVFSKMGMFLTQILVQTSVGTFDDSRDLFFPLQGGRYIPKACFCEFTHLIEVYWHRKTVGRQGIIVELVLFCFNSTPTNQLSQNVSKPFYHQKPL